MNFTHLLNERLPPLNALRSFEAAGRLESFNRAAHELHVTPSAVSHQIRSLEDFLGTRLFVRQTRQVRLTDDGQELLAAVQQAFGHISTAVRRIQRQDDDGSLTLQCSPNFATEWLVPRLLLSKLAARHLCRICPPLQVFGCRMPLHALPYLLRNGTLVPQGRLLLVVQPCCN